MPITLMGLAWVLDQKRSPHIREVSMIRSSAAEHLTFVAASGKGGVEAVYADENIWLTQKMMGGVSMM